MFLRMYTQVGQYLENEYPKHVLCHLESFAKFFNFFRLLFLFIGNVYMVIQIYICV
jgi:hypothetical protein